MATPGRNGIVTGIILHRDLNTVESASGLQPQDRVLTATDIYFTSYRQKSCSRCNAPAPTISIRAKTPP